MFIEEIFNEEIKKIFNYDIEIDRILAINENFF